MPPAPKVPVLPLVPASAATVAFRSRGRLHVTAVVKATFAIIPEGRMTPLAPDPIIPDELPDPSGRGLRAAGDLAPYLAQTDVLLTGHAEVLPSFSAPELRVWLAVVREGAVRIDRWLELDASARVGPARAHLDIHGAGPISREWPRRSQLLGGMDPRRLQGPLVDIPEGLDWSYFQAAPAEQRMEPLRGDEWLVLGGVFAQRPRLRTQLPEARGVARLYRRGQAPPREGAPIQLIADTLQIDADRRCASILWRGHIRVEEAELSSLHVVAGVELSGRAIAWVDPFPNVQPAEENPLGETVGISKVQAMKLAAPATPFEKPRDPAPEEENPLAGTFAMPRDLALKAAAAPATPFEKPWSSPPPPRPTPRKQEPARAGPEAENPLAGTFTMPDELAAKLDAAPATPFERREARAAEAAPAWASTSPREAAMPPTAVAPVAPAAPFVEVARPAPLLAMEAPEMQPEGLGDIFLAAMAEAGEPA